MNKIEIKKMKTCVNWDTQSLSHKFDVSVSGTFPETDPDHLFWWYERTDRPYLAISDLQVRENEWVNLFSAYRCYTDTPNLFDEANDFLENVEQNPHGSFCISDQPEIRFTQSRKLDIMIGVQFSDTDIRFGLIRERFQIKNNQPYFASIETTEFLSGFTADIHPDDLIQMILERSQPVKRRKYFLFPIQNGEVFYEGERIDADELFWENDHLALTTRRPFQEMPHIDSEISYQQNSDNSEASGTFHISQVVGPCKLYLS